MVTAKNKKKFWQSGSVWLILLALVGLTSLIAFLLHGTDVALLNPKGLVAGKQLRLALFSVMLMLMVAIPTLVLLYTTAWKYRESNNTAEYEPNAQYGKLFICCLWAVPSIIVFALASMMWPTTHKLEPHKPIVSNIKPVTIQVIAQRWKWLFIYPEQNIATVNFVQFPVDTPIQFELTADEAPMSSFWVPHLGGQLYAMTGHTNQLNLMADELGDYQGSSAEINGTGFAGMKFVARGSSKQDFDAWVQGVKQSSSMLDSNEYAQLLKPSENNKAAYYTTTKADLYDAALMKYKGSHDHQTEHK